MIGFICALDVEVEGIKKLMENKSERTYAKITYVSGTIHGVDVLCCECGVGKVNAAMSAQIMIDLYHPDVIINSGVAGSLSSEIKIGDIVISDDCVQHDMDGTEMGDPPGMIWFNDEKRIDIPCDLIITQRLADACKVISDSRVFRGRIASGDAFVASRDRRFGIAKTYGALACEMEGAAIGQVCYRNAVPFSILRSISDDFNENEFVDFEKFRDIAAQKTVRIVSEFLKNYR